MHQTELSSDIVFKGNIKFKKYLKISCTFEGSIDSNEGTLIISDQAKVNAHIKAKELLNYGTIIGDVEVKNLVTLYKNSHLTGNVQSLKLSIEEDAQFNGYCRMVNDSNFDTNKILTKDKFPLLDKK